MTVSREAWLAALGQSDIVDDPEALTISELMVLLKCGERSARFRVDRLVAQGKAVAVKKHNGRCVVKAYKLK